MFTTYNTKYRKYLQKNNNNKKQQKKQQQKTTTKQQQQNNKANKNMKNKQTSKLKLGMKPSEKQIS